MKLTSNIGQIKHRLQRLQEGLPEAVKTAIDPKFWGERLQHVAYVTLRSQWAAERNIKLHSLYERMSNRIAQSIVADALSPLGSRFTMGLENLEVSGALDIAGAADYNLGQVTPTGRPARYAIQTPGGEETLEAARQAVRDWVLIEKDIRAEDAGKSVDEIADDIMDILGIGEHPVPRSRSDEVGDAAGRLQGAIQKWLDGEGENPPTKPKTAKPEALDPKTARSWLSAVMLAWRAYVQAHLRDRLELQLIKLKHRIETELI